jgi:hypothetical protein
MKNVPASWVRRLLTVCPLSLLTFFHAYSQDTPRVIRPFELGLSVGGFIKTMEGSAGLGGVLVAEPRYFIKPGLAITARYQGAAYFTTPIDVSGDEKSVNISSILAGVLLRNRSLQNAFFWGVQTGVALTSEYLGNDADGYAIYGNRQTFWVLQPRIGYAFGRFETELAYHYSPAREARFGQLSIGWRFWGKKKS